MRSLACVPDRECVRSRPDATLEFVQTGSSSNAGAAAFCSMGLLRARPNEAVAMSRLAKAAWLDRFATPSAAMLRAAYPKERAVYLDALRHGLGQIDGLSESIAWQGVPWRWSFVYSMRGREDDIHAWAYVIPDLEKLRVCVTLTADDLRRLNIRRMKRWIRDGIVFARSVGGVSWATFEVDSRAATEDLLDLLRRKAKPLPGQLVVTTGGARGGRRS